MKVKDRVSRILWTWGNRARANMYPNGSLESLQDEHDNALKKIMRVIKDTQPKSEEKR